MCRFWVERDRSPTSHTAVHANSTVYDGYVADTGRPSSMAPLSAQAEQFSVSFLSVRRLRSKTCRWAIVTTNVP